MLHHLIVAYILFGGVAVGNNKQYLQYHLIFNMFILIQWLVNDNKCIISQYEGKGESEFTQELLASFGLNVDSRIANYIAYVLVIIPLLNTCRNLTK